MRVRRHTTDTQNDASVLYSAIGIIQLSPHTADVRPYHLADHFSQPIPVDRFNIVIHQSNNIPGRQGGPVIIDGGVIKGVIPAVNGYPMIRCQRVEIGQRTRTTGLVIRSEERRVGKESRERRRPADGRRKEREEGDKTLFIFFFKQKTAYEMAT